MGTGSFLGVKRPGPDADHPPHLAPRLKKEYSYSSTSLWAFVAGYRVKFTFTLYIYIYVENFIFLMTALLGRNM
jgi:hypothetical protein